MAAFGGAGLLSIVPTRQYARWRERAANSSAAPSIEETARVRRFVTAELVLFPAIPITAALLARGIGV